MFNNNKITEIYTFKNYVLWERVSVYQIRVLLTPLFAEKDSGVIRSSIIHSTYLHFFHSCRQLLTHEISRGKYIKTFGSTYSKWTKATKSDSKIEVIILHCKIHPFLLFFSKVGRPLQRIFRKFLIKSGIIKSKYRC